jgi:hypothetical protein
MQTNSEHTGMTEGDNFSVDSRSCCTRGGTRIESQSRKRWSRLDARTFCERHIAGETVGQRNDEIEFVDLAHGAEHLHADLELAKVERLDELWDAALWKKETKSIMQSERV